MSKLFSGINMHVPNKKNLKPNFWIFFYLLLNQRWVTEVHLLSIYHIPGFFSIHMNEVFLNYLQNQNLIYNFLIIFKLKFVLSLPCRKFWKNNYFLRKYEFTNQRKFWLKVNKYEVWFLLHWFDWNIPGLLISFG